MDPQCPKIDIKIFHFACLSQVGPFLAARKSVITLLFFVQIQKIKNHATPNSQENSKIAFLIKFAKKKFEKIREQKLRAAYLGLMLPRDRPHGGVLRCLKGPQFTCTIFRKICVLLQEIMATT
jgi:hypothetical protein